MTEIESQYGQARRLLRQVEQTLQEFEKREASASASAANSSNASSRVVQENEELQRAARQLEATLRISLQLPAAEHSKWKKKVEHVLKAADVVQASVARLTGRVNRRLRELQQREDLLGGVRVDMEAAMNQEQAQARSRQSLANSSRLLDEAMQVGTSVMVQMGATRERLKGAQRKARDMLNTLGLSDSLLRVAERRLRRDAWAVLIGIVVVALLLVLMMWVWK